MNPKLKTAKGKVIRYEGPNRVIVHHGSKDVTVRLAVNQEHLPVTEEIEFDPAKIIVEQEVVLPKTATAHTTHAHKYDK